ncbi:MAG: 16S rRNA (cytidine(1402)-2'-O)-methyltransferase [Chthoniobacterales bacterium]|nr:16S rRNA (cytidine(1402)-2'-O)-methyltransferase [Chthoniobacterales bacterium]
MSKRKSRPPAVLPPLTLVATPIGNLGDLTLRAIEALRCCDGVIAEDTRRTAQLLAHLEIRKPLISFHEHNEDRRLPELMSRLASGEKLCLVTDAGTPSVSDPGFRLVRECIKEKVEYTVLPGPSAVTTALVGSGLPPVPFHFGGFLPSSGSGRRSELRRALGLGMTGIYFESPYRLVASLTDLVLLSPLSRLCVSRELTKIHEEYRHGTPAELAAHYTANPPRGEVTLVIHPSSENPEEATGKRRKKSYSEKTPMPRNLS